MIKIISVSILSILILSTKLYGQIPTQCQNLSGITQQLCISNYAYQQRLTQTAQSITQSTETMQTAQAVQTTSAAVSTEAPVLNVPCNGYTELCNKRYNDIAYIEAHNATSTVDPHSLIPNAPSVVQNQDISIEEQLNLGIRSFEFHVHLDYVNLLGYYNDLIRVAQKDTDAAINAALARVQQAHAADFKKLTDARTEVAKWQSSIDDLRKQITDLDNWWNSLPDFSVTGDSKALRALDYGARKGAFETAVASAEKFKDAAITILNTANALWQQLIQADPELIKLRTQQTALSGALSLTTIGGQAATTKQIFMCHGLPKSDLYSVLQSPDDILKDAPEQVKVALRPFLQTIMDRVKNAAKMAIGDPAQEGGAFPYSACLIDTGRRTLEGFLVQIKQWLDTHPNDVITLFVNDFVNNNDLLAVPFTNSGILNYAYRQDPSKLWPTIGQLIQAKKRLIILKDDPVDPTKYPWINRSKDFAILDTKFGYTSIEQITNEGPGLENILTDGAIAKLNQINACKQAAATPTTPVSPECQALLLKNKIFRFTHNVTVGLAGDKNAATVVNSKNILLPRLVKIAKGINQAPNFASLDFVQVPDKQAIDAVNQFNGVGPYAGKPAWQPAP